MSRSNRWALPLLDEVLNPAGVRLLELSDIDAHHGMPPAEEADRPPGQGSPSPAPQVPVSRQPVKMPRVLLVDDSPTMRRVLRGLLEDAGIHVVGEAADGAEGVELAAALRPDVVLMDWRMPRLDGVQATARIRQQLPEVQVVVFTSLEGAGIGTAARDGRGERLRHQGGVARTALRSGAGCRTIGLSTSHLHHAETDAPLVGARRLAGFALG